MNLDKVTCPRCKRKEKYMFSDESMCWNCQKEAEILILGQRAKQEGSTSYENHILCPHCGEHYGEDDMHDSTDVVCDGCNKRFYVEIEYDIKYSTNKIK